MRADINEVVIERPRHGSRSLCYSYNGRRAKANAQDWEEAPFREGLHGSARRYAGWYGSKEFSDLINPLERFLRSNRGRKWDDVYSEICQVLKTKSLQGYHIKEQHLKPMVELNPRLINGQYYHPAHTWRSRENYPFFEKNFYVDCDGILREGTVNRDKYYASFHKPAPPPNYMKIKDRDFHKVNGCWHESIKGLVPQRFAVGTEPVIFEDGTEGSRTIYETRMVPGIIKVKQLNTKELQRVGLVNDKASKRLADSRKH